MVIIMKPNARLEDISFVINYIKRNYGLRVDTITGEYQTIIGLIGEENYVDFGLLELLPGVERAHRIQIPYKLVSRSYHSGDHIINVKGVRIGGSSRPVFIAGPCSIESKKQLFHTVAEIYAAGADVLRGGAFKPRSSVHSFQGLGEQALEFLALAGEEYGMPTVTEVRGETQVQMVSKYVDILQIGARNMYNQDLIESVARQQKPVLLKRHFGAGIDEFLNFSERAIAEGNRDVMLCERGLIPIGKGRQHTRYMLDLSVVPLIKKESYLPIIVDPSHATGRRDLVFPMSLAAIAAGAHGIMVEVHHQPEKALSDGPQMIRPNELQNLITTSLNIYQYIKQKDEE